MHFDFFKQRVSDGISTGDEIAVFVGRQDEDVLDSGRYTVAKLQSDAEGSLFATLIGMGPLEGTVAMIDLGVNGEAYEDE